MALLDLYINISGNWFGIKTKQQSETTLFMVCIASVTEQQMFSYLSNKKSKKWIRKQSEIGILRQSC